MRFWDKPQSRPEFFTLNPNSPLFGNLVFAGLGNRAGSTYYHDATGNNPGTLTGYTGAGNTPSTQWQYDNYLKRTVLGFNGSSDYVALTPNGKFIGDFTGTFAAWCNFSLFATAIVIAYGDASGSARQAWSLGISSSGNIACYYSSCNAVGVAGLTLNQWGHLAVTKTPGYIDGTTTLYVNGIPTTFPSAGGTPAIPTSGLAYNIGRWVTSGVYPTAKLADVIASKSALNQSVISDLANPSNFMLSCGGVPLLLPPRRISFACAGGVTFDPSTVPWQSDLIQPSRDVLVPVPC